MSHYNIVIKPANIDDAATLSTVALQAYKDHYLHLWHDGGAWYMQHSFSTQQFVQELQDANAKFFLVYASQQPVGFIKLNINAPVNNDTNALELERIYFTNNATGKGVGSTAVKFVINLAQQLNKQTVWLKVMDTSTAPIAFYKKHGFTICGISRITYPQMKEELRGMYVMKKEMNFH